ncbi:putative PHD type zinc finger protein with BAH domain-containing protein [Coemansia sp. RSA 1933]|nr:putative PHD type zinc finger protein with BAH domain-containing protein [Coemansia sp. RSA 1933]
MTLIKNPHLKFFFTRLDHVYLQPEYSEEPFYIGRVMEFVYVPRVRQPKITMSGDKRDGTPTPSSTPVTAAQLRARLAWFQRPRDLPVTRVRAKDSRLLVATMHSDINPVSAIKGKCFVRHITEIAELGAWKSKPDHYYYTQLFDRYSTRLYDMIPVSQIRNAPQDVLQKLHDTYEFIFAEAQKITDLVNTRRACTICAKWCSVNESLKCALCEKHYHMECLDPPLARKPAKGYTWQCASCMRRKLEQREKSVDDTSNTANNALEPGDRKRTTRSSSSDEFAITLRSSATAGATTPSGTAASAAVSDTESRSGSKRLKLSNGDSRYSGDITGSAVPRPRNRGIWPFRYFGINTNIDDVLHDDERIYPRAVSRIGPKYQAIIPDMVSASGPELDSSLLEQHARMHGDYEGDMSHGKANLLRQKPNGNITPTTYGATNQHQNQNGLRGKDSSGVSGGGWTSGGVSSGGGGGTTRWHSKSAEQMDAAWDEIEARRGNHDEQIFFKKPSYLPDSELEMYMSAIVPFLCRHFSGIYDFSLLDCQDAALHGLALHGYDVEEALISIPECPEGYIRQREPGDYWTEEGLARFNDCLREYGSNLHTIHSHIPENTRRAITLHYYMIRPTNLGMRLLEAYDNRNHSGQRRPNLGQGEGAVNVHVEVASDTGLSSSNTPASSPRTTGMTTRDHSRLSNDHNEKALRCLNCARDRVSRWLLFAHGNIVMDGVMGLSKDMWMRQCSVCMQTDGAAVKCVEAGCGEGAHAHCAHVLTSDGSDSPHASRAILVGRIENPAIAPSRVLESISAFIKAKEKIRVVVKCAKHAHTQSKNDIALDAVDDEGSLVVSAVIAAKRAGEQMQLRGAMLHAHGVKSPLSGLVQLWRRAIMHAVFNHILADLVASIARR